jgi:hypothetical protein
MAAQTMSETKFFPGAFFPFWLDTGNDNGKAVEVQSISSAHERRLRHRGSWQMNRLAGGEPETGV